MRHVLKITISLSYYFCLVLSSSTADDQKIRLEILENQVEWIRNTEGGFYHQDLKFQEAKKESDSFPIYGIFTESHLKQGEVLAKIPPNCFVMAKVEDEVPNTCHLARFLANERDLGSKSSYEPYIRYLFDTNGITPPVILWSKEAQKLLLDIIGEELSPIDLIQEYSFESTCSSIAQEKDDAEKLNVAFEIASRRNWDDIMIPFLDMCNHRNGKYYNADVWGDGTSLLVTAQRDIEAGEQLCISYNDGKASQPDSSTLFVTPHILKNYGFVEEYPRRWMFFEEYEDILVAEIDIDVNGAKSLTRISATPSPRHIRMLYGQLQHQKELEHHVMQQSEMLENEYEKNVILEFYQGQIEAMETTIYASEVLVKTECNATTCPLDSLELINFKTQFGEPSCLDSLYEEYEELDSVRTIFQQLQFLRNPHEEEHKDTCLHMDNIVHVCQSSRPNYHEVMVHYPASFLDEVKRVVFLGGGDNMLLHEILKYPSLELVVGLELDQQVVQSCFKHFRTQPHFDNPKVEWWFGDAAKSLLIMQQTQEYYGTFDLVIVDLLSEVINRLKVTSDMTIMDAAFKLLKPNNGVIIRNVDYGFDSNPSPMNYDLHLFFVDFPYFCCNGFVIGSNGIDFFRKTPIDHGIDTIYHDVTTATASQVKKFDMWFNYHKNVTNLDVDICYQEMKDLEKEINEVESQQPGVIFIIDAENSEKLSEIKSIQRAISSILTELDLSLVSVRSANNASVFLLNEGYIVAQTWLDLKYCALDIFFWNSFNKEVHLKDKLISLIGSTTTSSYRFITSGMFKLENPTPGFHSGSCLHEDVPSNILKPKDITTFNDSELSYTILSEASLISQHDNINLVLLCHDKDCNDLEQAFDHTGNEHLHFIKTCSDLVHNCYDTILAGLQLFVKSKKIGGIVLSPFVPKHMGQIFHKIMNNTNTRMELLEEQHIVIEVSLDSTQSSWRRDLLDRFRTFPITFQPAFRAEVIFKNEENDQAELGIFSKGDSSFLSRLFEILKSIELKTNLVADVRNVRNAMNRFHAEFKPSKVYSFDDYDLTSYNNQLKSQNEVGKQMFFEFQLKDDRYLKSLSLTLLKGFFQKLLESLDINHNIQGFGDAGNTLVCFWPEGIITLLWNGGKTIHFNVFLKKIGDKNITVNLYNSIVREFPTFQMKFGEQHPRGTGRIVAFAD